MFYLKASLEVPEWAGSAVIAERAHNRFVKEILREELQNHLDKRIDRHFQYSAHGRYKFESRTAKYLRMKIKNRGRTMSHWNPPVTFAADSNLDLVKTGKTKREIKSGAKQTVSGVGRLIQGRLTLKVPIPGSTGRMMDFAAAARLIAAGKRRKLGDRIRAQQRLDITRRTVNEIERFAPDEIQELNQSMATKYAARLNSRKRVKKR